MAKGEPNIFSAAGRKLSLFPEKVTEWENGTLPLPITLEIQPSERCNHSCPNCQAQFALTMRRTRELAKLGQFLDLKAIETVWDNPPDGIVISGHTGDPLLHPQLADLMATIQRLEIPCVLITNGQAFTDELIEIAVRTCRGIRISLDASDEASFRAMHGKKANWFLTMEAIRKLVKAKAKFGSANCRLGIGYLTGSRPHSEALDAAVLAKQLGVDYIQFRPLHYSDLSTQHFDPTIYEIESQEFSILASDHKFEGAARSSRPYSACLGANFYTVIDARADVYICCHHVGVQDAKIGSLTTESWIEIMKGRLRAEVIERFPKAACIPNCRLDSINKWLSGDPTGRQMSLAGDLSKEVIEHAAFL